ncbi:MAG: hypothetical protein Q4A58_01950 [Fusobacterium sp.]|uniref:YlxM family DNA-binding protein n=1 Tax=Fusobacterium sp. TaxID=68766 RepID=UPI0026DB8381|nr:hypothetical protein [Fusobacterium sp.]MDO4690049.1 hypothetical protein [Fusobacterium sp.]
MNLEEFVTIASLLDIYSELLSGKQKEYMIEHFEKDLSLSEIAKSKDVSRQAVHDNIKRGVVILNDYEAKLGIYKKKLELKEELLKLKADFVIERLDKIIDEII